MFTLALDADEEYQARLKGRNALALKLEEAKIEVATLRDRLNVLLAVMRAGERPVGDLAEPDMAL